MMISCESNAATGEFPNEEPDVKRNRTSEHPCLITSDFAKV